MAFDGQLDLRAGTKREEMEDPRFMVWATGRMLVPQTEEGDSPRGRGRRGREEGSGTLTMLSTCQILLYLFSHIKAFKPQNRRGLCPAYQEHLPAFPGWVRHF